MCDSKADSEEGAEAYSQEDAAAKAYSQEDAKAYSQEAAAAQETAAAATQAVAATAAAQGLGTGHGKLPIAPAGLVVPPVLICQSGGAVWLLHGRCSLSCNLRVALQAAPPPAAPRPSGSLKTAMVWGQCGGKWNNAAYPSELSAGSRTHGAQASVMLFSFVQQLDVTSACEQPMPDDGRSTDR